MSHSIRPRVMVIDDEPSICKFFQIYLSDHGFDVRSYSDGRAAVGSFPRDCPDILLLDIQMPGLDGLGVLAEVQSLSPQTPVVMLSGSPQIAKAVDALRLGAWDYIIKPARPQDILHAIEVAMERARILQKQTAVLDGIAELLAAEQARCRELSETLARERISNENMQRDVGLLQLQLATVRQLDQDLSYQVDSGGKLLFISEAVRSLGYAPAALVGRPMVELIHPADRLVAEHRIAERRTGTRATRRFPLRLLSSQAASSGDLVDPPHVLLWAEGLYNEYPPNPLAYAGTLGTMRAG